MNIWLIACLCFTAGFVVGIASAIALFIALDDS